MGTRSKLLALLFCLVCLSCLQLSAQEGGKTLFSLPPFERAVVCIKHFEGLHSWKDYIRGNTKSKTNYTYDIDIQQIKEDRKKYEKSQCFPFASHFGLKRG